MQRLARPIRTPSLRSLKPKDGKKADEKSTLQLFGLSEGTFALQAHDPKSEIHYRNIRVKVLD